MSRSIFRTHLLIICLQKFAVVEIAKSKRSASEFFCKALLWCSIKRSKVHTSLVDVNEACPAFIHLYAAAFRIGCEIQPRDPCVPHVQNA